MTVESEAASHHVVVAAVGRPVQKADGVRRRRLARHVEGCVGNGGGAVGRRCGVCIHAPYSVVIGDWGSWESKVLEHVRICDCGEREGIGDQQKLQHYKTHTNDGGCVSGLVSVSNVRQP